MKKPKLMAFIVMLVVFIPLIMVPEIEENPLSHPTYYEEKTTLLKDYDIITELKDLEKEGVSTAVFQPDMDELESEIIEDQPNSNQNGIKDVSGSFGEGSSSINMGTYINDGDLRNFIEEKLTRFKEANLHPSYFIISDVRYRYKISTLLNDITEELKMPKIQLMVKNNEEELSTALLVYLEREAIFNTPDYSANPAESSLEVDIKFEEYVCEYLSLEHLAPNKVLTIDTQDWDETVARALDKFLKVITKNNFNIVIRIENISKVTSPEGFEEIISVIQRSSVLIDDEPIVEEIPPSIRGSRSRGLTEEAESENNENEADVKEKHGNRHVQEIILGATPEYSAVVSIKDDSFTLVIDVINGFYYIILLTCVLPNIFFVTWAGFIRREKIKSKQNTNSNATVVSKIKKSMGELIFNRKLRRLENELGNVILVNSDVNFNEKNFSGDKNGPNKSIVNKKGSKWPDVTIIVPCFNEQKGIALAVEKCFNQDYPGRIEILIIDDGSRDYTLKIAKIFEGPFPNRLVRAFHKPNGGKADAINYGVKRATGQVILTTDGDSHMDPNAVTSIVRGFLANPSAGIVGGFVVIRNEKDSPLVKLQQVEYIFTQDVFRLPQSESSSVLIIPGPVFSMGGSVAKSYEASTRTCVEDADLTDTILSDNWGTAATTEAMAYTQAPTSWKAWFKQRKRWVYGQFQVWRENKSFLKKNFWGIYNYFTWLSALIITCLLIISLIALAFIGEWNFFSFLITAQTTVIFLIYFVTRGISLWRYKYGRRLIKYLPLQIIYDTVNGALCAYLFLRYLLGKGVEIKFGPELVHIH